MNASYPFKHFEWMHRINWHESINALKLMHHMHWFEFIPCIAINQSFALKCMNAHDLQAQILDRTKIAIGWNTSYTRSIRTSSTTWTHISSLGILSTVNLCRVTSTTSFINATVWDRNDPQTFWTKRLDLHCQDWESVKRKRRGKKRLPRLGLRSSFENFEDYYDDDQERDKRLPRLGLRSPLPRLGIRAPMVDKRLPRLGMRSPLPRLGVRSPLPRLGRDEEDEDYEEDNREKRLPRIGLFSRASPFPRLGDRAAPFPRLGKRSPFPRLGRAAPFPRLGRSTQNNISDKTELLNTERAAPFPRLGWL